MEWKPENPHKECIAAECIYEDWLEDDGRKHRFCEDLKREGFAEGSQQAARLTVEWFEEVCSNHHKLYLRKRRECADCWKEFKEKARGVEEFSPCGESLKDGNE